MTELQQFHQFVGKTLQNGGNVLSIQQCVDAFRSYQDEVQALRKALDVGQQGTSKPLELNALIARVTERLAKQGITE